MPQGWKARKVYGTDKALNMWVTCEDDDGNMKTFGAGETYSIIGHGE